MHPDRYASLERALNDHLERVRETAAEMRETVADLVVVEIKDADTAQREDEALRYVGARIPRSREHGPSVAATISRNLADVAAEEWNVDPDDVVVSVRRREVWEAEREAIEAAGLPTVKETTLESPR